jgi:hypothetical protein
MKNILYTSLTVLYLVLFIFAGNTYSGDRMVLVERFTSATCGPCAQNNPIMDAFLSSQDPDKIVGISYHQNWPVAGLDPMYNYNPGDNETRRNYYGVSYIPQAKFDGLIQCDPPYTQSGLQAYFDQRKNILSPITIIVTDSTFADSVLVRALIYCEALLSSPAVTVQFAVVEKHIHYSSPPGTNGETDFYDVMRKMLPNANGTSLALYPGQTYIVEKKFKMDPIWQVSEIRPLVFVQAGNKEILNAALKPTNFTLLPNPGYRVVTQGQSQSGAYKVSIPFVAQGYNSAVTLTASVDPPNAGITTSFPSGNVISHFPDSVTVQVNSSSSVPTGTYTIIVTGTSASGKVHKITMGYLVGKNYIFVGSNRPTLQFKVDNVTYNSTQFFNWDIGSTHTLAAISPQTFGSTRYIFQSWSNNGDTTQNVNITASMSTFIVNYKIQFKLISSHSPSGIPATITGGNIFYDSGSVANLVVAPLMVQYNNQDWFFQGWQGAGNGSYTGGNPAPQIPMNNVIIETALWDTIPAIGIRNLNNEVPKIYSLEQNYPNPFNPATQIKFALPKDGYVNIKVYDILGNEVAVIYNGFSRAGYYEVQFDASNLASGVYFYKMSSNDFTSVKRMLLVK